MDLLSNYSRFCEQIDRQEDLDALKEYQKRTSVKVLREEFWKQRKLYLGQGTPLDKQRALAKLQWLQNHFCCRIPLRRTVNRFSAPDGLYGIYIAGLSLIGRDCIICQNVTIAAETAQNSTNRGYPSVGNNVYIGPGATIIGNVHVGHHSRIEANCCVTEDIPPYSVVRAGKPEIVVCTASDYREYVTPDEYVKELFQTVHYDYLEHTDCPDLITEKAVPSDIEEIWNLYKQRTLWLRWKKQAQWIYYLDHHPKAEYLERIANGEYYVVRKGRQIIAGFSLSTDSESWNDSSTNAWYLCRVVSLVGYRHVGAYIAAEAKRLADEAGIDSLRLECVSSNESLNKVWEEHGFRLVRVYEGRYRCSLREYSSIPTQEDIPIPETTPVAPAPETPLAADSTVMG